MSNNEEKSTFKEYFLPISILIAAVLISGALIISTTSGDNTASVSDPTESSSAKNVAEVTEDDHIRGSIDAPIKIIEFSDLECPFCQQFHGTMKEATEEYGDQVAWVYRHFPLTNIHPEAKKAAEASECVAELAGEDAFWQYTDEIFANQSSLGSGLIEQAATDVGADANEFQECMDSDRHIERVESDQNNGIESGAEGTPFSVIVTENGDYSAIPGSLPFESSDPTEPTLKSIIDSVLSNL